MSTALVERELGETRSTAQTVAEIGLLRELPLASLFESPWNPRTYFSETALEELAQSIRGKGITTPLIVRPKSDVPEMTQAFEIGAGARRFRAAKMAGLNLVPCIVRALDDAAFLELICFENLQREDPHPLDEAAGYQRYLRETGCSADALAQKTGVSRSQVYARLKLAEGLIEAARQACWDGKITASHAILIARLQPKEQEKALKYCLSNPRLPSERDLRNWIAFDVCLELAKAPFDLSAEDLVPADRHAPAPGSCTCCPKRSLNSPHLFPELQPGQPSQYAAPPGSPAYDPADVLDDKSADVCTDPGCFQQKLKAHLVKIEASLTAKHGNYPTKITMDFAGKKGVLGRQSYEIVKASDPGAKPALVVTGARVGQVLYIKSKPGTSAASTAGSSTQPRYGSEEYKRREAEQQKKQKREDSIRLAILKAVRQKVQLFTRQDVEALVLNEIEAMWGADELLAELYGLKKESRLERDVLAAQVPKLSGIEFARLVVELGVMDSDGEIDEKRLGLAAKRYKVDAGKIRQEMEAAFRQQDQPQPEGSAAAAKPKPAPKKAASPKKAKAGKSKITMATRRRIAEQQKKRWAEFRKQQGAKK